MRKISYLIPIILILSLSCTIYWTGFHKMISFETLREHHKELREIVMENKVMAPLFFIVIHALSIALCLPGGFFLSLFGGFLFPESWRILYVMISITLGNLILFLVIRTGLKILPREQASSWLKLDDTKTRKNIPYFLLAGRLSPLVPWGLVNGFAAFINISMWTFVWTTFVGLVPQVFFYTQAGSKLNMFFESQKDFAAVAVLQVKEKVLLTCLGICVLIFMQIRAYSRKKKEPSQSQ